ncbi:MAG: efflux RND transporter periplasmic adaptor subunit [Capnocytophaga sp.]|nr:efflux RND transporter periplasmic adaptor subunit [Capnocytophaga sp.]
MKKGIKNLIIALIVVGIIALAYLFFGKEKATFIELQTQRIENGDVTTEVTATGSVQPMDEIEVGTQVSGLVSKIYVDFNSQVKKGQLLAELDKINLQENVTNALASYNSALNERNYYQQNFDRQKKMYDAQVISLSEYEQATYQLNNAKAIVTQRQTALAQARTNLGYANIYAPIDGIILSREVEEGQTVTASMSTPTLFTIAKDITKMQVEANVDEADIGQVKVGQRVSFTVDAYPNEEFSGKVIQVRLSPTTTSNVVTYTVIIGAENPEEKLKPGLTATIIIYTNELKNIPIISSKAVNFQLDTNLLSQYYQQQNINATVPQEVKQGRGKIKYVWTKNNDGSIAQKEITVGSNDGINIQLTGGLSVGDEVVTGLQEIQPQQAGKTSGSNSPFMPTPPNRNNSKSTQK